jgi:small subunit ribosomal protein S13
MARIVGVDIPSEKVTWVALTYVHGIGKKTAFDILEAVGVNPQRRVKDLTDEELARITTEIEKNYVVEGNLRRQVQQNISRLKEIACYRGIRHRRGLPVRGQRTRTNARTRKGPRKTVAGKKKAPRK